MFSQNNEEELILNYFGGRTGNLIDIGANDGITLSNTHEMINRGWKGVLLEPSPKAFSRLSGMYKHNSKVWAIQAGIGSEDKEVEFWESGAFNHTGPDVALVSCIDPKEKQRWGNSVAFEPTKIKLLTFKTMLSKLYTPFIPPFQFINIDAEGMDYEILKQVNLTEIGCECFCIEHNSVAGLMSKYRGVADYFGFRELGCNAENLIFGK